jgi:hypothetical protein
MKDWLACEIGHKYEKTVSLYRKKGDEKPLLSTTVSGDYRISVRKLLVGCAVAAALTAFLCLAAELDKKEGKD